MSGPRNHTTKDIMDAIRKGNAREVERYLEQNPDSANNAIQGMTPLHLAASHIRNDERIILMLIEAGADINAEDQAGNTPLHLAAINKNETAIKLFIQFGADANAKNQKDETPAERIAKLPGYDAVIKLMEAEYSKATLADVQGEVGPEYNYNYISDEELNEIMQIVDEVAEHAIQYPSSADYSIDELLEDLAEYKSTQPIDIEHHEDAEELRRIGKEAEEKEFLDELLHELEETDKQNNRISEWLRTFDRSKLDDICNDLGFPKDQFPELHLILHSHEEEIRDRHQRRPITMSDFNKYLQKIHTAKSDRSLQKALHHIGINWTKMPEGQFDLLLDANKERVPDFISKAKDNAKEAIPTTEEFMAKEKSQASIQTDHAASYLDNIKEIMKKLPATSGTKRKYRKIIENGTLDDTAKVDAIIEIAKTRDDLVGKRSSTLFRNVDESKAIHKAIAAIDTNKPYSKETGLGKAIEQLEQQAKKRADVLQENLNTLGFRGGSSKKK